MYLKYWKCIWQISLDTSDKFSKYGSFVGMCELADSDDESDGPCELVDSEADDDDVYLADEPESDSSGPPPLVDSSASDTPPPAFNMEPETEEEEDDSSVGSENTQEEVLIAEKVADRQDGHLGHRVPQDRCRR